MQVLEQVEETKQEYTFEEICPEWSQILADNGGFMENRKADFEATDGNGERTIMNCATCIVGEAWGGK